MTNLDSIFKSRGVTLLMKVPLVRTMVFPVVMYGCESWTVKKAEHWRLMLLNCGAGENSCEFNQSILKETSPGCSLEGLMLRLKLQSFGHLMWRISSLEKTLMLGGIGGRRRRGWQKIRCLNGITNSMVMNLDKLWDLVMDRDTWHAAIHGITKSRTWLSDWTELRHSSSIIAGSSSIIKCNNSVRVWYWSDFFVFLQTVFKILYRKLLSNVLKIT